MMTAFRTLVPAFALMLVPVGARSAPQQAPPQPQLVVPDAGVDVPMRIDGNRLLVDVKVNGRGPFAFQLDTGASGAARADSSLVNELKLETVGEARASAGGGQVVSMPIVRFDTLDIGSIHISTVDAPSRDYNRPGTPPISGVLALTLFKDYLVTLDFEKSVLRIAKGTLPAPDDQEVLPVDMSHRIPAIPLHVGSEVVVADVDTGSMGGITVPQAVASRLTLASPPKVVGHAMTVSGPMDISAAPLAGNVTIGRYTIANPTIEFSTVLPRGNLGLRVLRQFVVTLDQHAGRIRLTRTAAGPITIS